MDDGDKANSFNENLEHQNPIKGSQYNPQSSRWKKDHPKVLEAK